MPSLGAVVGMNGKSEAMVSDPELLLRFAFGLPKVVDMGGLTGRIPYRLTKTREELSEIL